MFKTGFYELDITPPLGGCMPGYFTERHAEGIKRPLFVHALAVEADGKCVIIVSVDALGLGEKVYKTAVQRIYEKTGIPEEQILIHATHIHTGGPIRDVEDPPYYKPDLSYYDVHTRKIADCAILAYQRLAPSTASFAKGEVHGVAFVRNFLMKDGSVRTNPGRQNPDIVKPISENDPELPAMFFFDEQGNPKGLLVNFTLHHDCVGGMLYSNDYSGALANELKEAFGKDFITVFMNGTCGNINHVDVNMPAPPDRDISGEIGKKLAEEVKRLYSVAEEFEISSVAFKKERIMIPRHKISKEDIEEAKYLVETISLEGKSIDMSNPETDIYKRAKAARLLRFAELPDEFDTPVQAIRLGNAYLFAVPGEMFAQYGKYMKANSPSKVNFVAELANGGPGCYIPTPDAFAPSVYESQIPSSSLVPEAGEMIAKCAVKLANEIK